MKKLTVFLASSDNTNPEFIRAIKQLAQLLTEENVTLVYGGSASGLMGQLANATLACGGEVIGVYPLLQQKTTIEQPLCNLTQLIYVNSIAERIKVMQELGDAFMVLPGGLGTLEELFIIWNQIRLGLLQKPLGILDVCQFYSRLHHFFIEDMKKENFITQKWLNIPFFSPDLNGLYQRLKAATHTSSNEQTHFQ